MFSQLASSPYHIQAMTHCLTNQLQPLICFRTHRSSSKPPSLSHVVHPKQEGWVLPLVTNRGWRVMKHSNWKGECGQPKPFKFYIWLHSSTVSKIYANYRSKDCRSCRPGKTRNQWQWFRPVCHCQWSHLESKALITYFNIEFAIQ